MDLSALAEQPCCHCRLHSQLYFSSLSSLSFIGKFFPTKTLALSSFHLGESFSAVLMSVSRFQIVRRNGNLTQKVFEEVIFREMFGVF